LGGVTNVLAFLSSLAIVDTSMKGLSRSRWLAASVWVAARTGALEELGNEFVVVITKFPRLQVFRQYSTREPLNFVTCRL
jgi:hypothetical protein